MEKKLEGMLLRALKYSKAQTKKAELMRETRFWRKSFPSFELGNMLSLLTKTELDDIRKNLNISGVSKLKKAELADVLEEAIPAHFKQIILLLDQERYDLLQEMKNSGYVVVDQDFPIKKAEALLKYGLAYPVKDGDRKLLTMPPELAGLFETFDRNEIQTVIDRNTGWIQLTFGMVYFYGVIETSLAIKKTESLMKSEVKVADYMNIVSVACDYYNQVKYSPYKLTAYEIFNGGEILDEQQSRKTIDYYPFTKKELIQASKPGYVDFSKEMERLFQFLKEGYDLTDHDKNKIASELIYIINNEVNPTAVMDYLQELFEFPSFEFLQQLTERIVNVSNNTRQWVLKGHTPNELSQKEKKHLHPLNIPTNEPKLAKSNVINIKDYTKVGRNDPCVCGSGKKYKKCCMK
ncbi:YecA family protein [Litchfieldia salsa]|uniref:SEC-C motif-containing protein n=1 Tax=Litchfieldia salsa TaxID=930152 RepID=A0A1H0Q353_9BACI|nr:SEC-C domain-containing protein [Litchfieldia salsa]SDP11136.1 SEC-C motif-containing protein [Litchfieldia salsa]